MTLPRPRPGLLEMSPYVTAKAKGAHRALIKLSSNESALGMSPQAEAAYQGAVSGLPRYPDPDARALREAIGRVHGINPDCLIIGAGSDEIIQLLIRGYAGEGEAILQTAHAFSYYTVAAAAAGVATQFANEVDLTASVDALLSAVTPATRLLFLANPNNPTGTVLPAGEIKRLRDGLRSDVILVLDGAYAEYMAEDWYTDGRDLVDASIAAGTDNVVMMRTFSKVHGLAALRVGWAYAPPSILSIMNRIRGPFNVAAPGLAAAEAAIQDRAFVEENVAHNQAERYRMATAMSDAGFNVSSAYGNFFLVLFDTNELAQEFMAKCEAGGVLVRSAASSGLPHAVRVSVGLTVDNDAFLKAAMA